MSRTDAECRSLEVWVTGVPAAQGSKRHVGNGRMIEQSKRVKPWREAVAYTALRQRSKIGGPLTGPLMLDALFVLPRPRTSTRTWPNIRPDLDKYLRAVMDALTTAGVWGDDGQVVAISAAKKYPNTVTPHAGVRLIIREVAE